MYSFICYNKPPLVFNDVITTLSHGLVSWMMCVLNTRQSAHDTTLWYTYRAFRREPKPSYLSKRSFESFGLSLVAVQRIWKSAQSRLGGHMSGNSSDIHRGTRDPTTVIEVKMPESYHSFFSWGSSKAKECNIRIDIPGYSTVEQSSVSVNRTEDVHIHPLTPPFS